MSSTYGQGVGCVQYPHLAGVLSEIAVNGWREIALANLLGRCTIPPSMLGSRPSPQPVS